MKTNKKDINGKEIFVGNKVSLSLSHFKGIGEVVLKKGMFLIRWSESDFSELDGDHLYAEIVS